jgi:hypothetical protein
LHASKSKSIYKSKSNCKLDSILQVKGMMY